MSSRYMAIIEQVDYSTKKSAVVGPDHFMSATDESFGEDRGVIAEEEMGQRGLNKPVPGGFKPDGGFNLWAEAENVHKILKLLTGTIVTTEPTAPGNGDYLHTMTPAETLLYASLLVGTGHGGAKGARHYYGAALKSCKFVAAPEKKLLLSPDWFCKDMEIIAAVAPTFSALDPFYFREGTVELDGGPEPQVISCEMEIVNKFKEDDIRLGNQTRQSAPLGGLEAKGSMDVMFEDTDHYEKFLGGGVTLQDGLVKVGVELKFDTSVVIAPGGVNYAMNILFKEVIYNTNKANVSKQEPIIQTLPFTCYAPTSGDQITIELQNALAAI